MTSVKINLSNLDNEQLQQLFSIVEYEGNELFFTKFEDEVRKRISDGRIKKVDSDLPTDWELFLTQC